MKKSNNIILHSKITPRINQSHVAALLLILSTLLVFSPALKNDFVNYDDSEYVTMNSHVNGGLFWPGIFWAFTSIDATNWHPLTWLSHMVDVQLFGLNPSGHHFSNIVFHCISVVLLFGFLRLASIKIWISAFAAALFAFHPLHVESVAWVAERKDVLCAVFWFGTAAAYIWYARQPSIKKYLLILFLFALGLLAKPMAVSLPIVLLLLDYWPLERFILKKRLLGKIILEKVPLFLMAAGSSLITLIAQKPAVASLTKYAFETRIVNAIISYCVYLQQTIWPVKLSVFYPYAFNNLASVKFIACSIILVGISIFIVFLGRSRKYLIVGWFWYLVTLIPVIGIVQVGNQAHADRYTYIPLTGIFIICGLVLDAIIEKYRAKRKIFQAVAIIVVITLMVTSWKQIEVWRNDITLFSHAAAVTENNYLAYYNLGVAFERTGKIETAITQYEKSIKAYPGFGEAHFGLGNLLCQADRIDEAIYYLNKAVEINPESIEFLSNLAGVYFQKQQIAMALELMQRALFSAKAQGDSVQINECLEKIGFLNQAISK
jgi:tetratricopeptide (TPR) repeat protein